MRISDWSSDVCSSDLDHRDRCVGGDREVDADVRADGRDQHIVDADDIALKVEQRTARIAAVDRGIGLDIAVIGAALADVALKRRDYTRGHRPAEPERMADREATVADAPRDAGGDFPTRPAGRPSI